MSQDFVLNHPWKIYLNEPISSYTEYDIYYKELNRFYKFVELYNEYLDKLKEDDVCLTILILGTPMEAALHNNQCSKIYEFQWQQLLPKNVFDFIKHYKKLNNNININIIIVSPDNIFMDEYYKEPLFTIKCDDCKFTKIKNREYIHMSDKLIIKVDIFTCPFPQLETNTNIINKINIFIKKFYEDYKIMDYSPTEEDITFINNFYEYFESICKNPKSNLLINSYAVFRNVREYDNYGLFPTLLEVADRNKIIATEWHFDEKNFKSTIVSKNDLNINYVYFKVSYVEPIYMPLILTEYVKTNIEEIRKLKKEYNDCGKLANEICILIKVPYKKIVYKKIKYF